MEEYQINRLWKLISKWNWKNFYLYQNDWKIKDVIFSGWLYNIIENWC